MYCKEGRLDGVQRDRNLVRFDGIHMSVDVAQQPEFQALKCCHIYLILLQVSERRARRGQKNEEDTRRNYDMIIKNHVRRNLPVALLDLL